MRKMLIWISGFLFLLLTAFSLSFAGESKQLRILYLNDFHGFAQSYSSAGHSEKTGGIAFLAGEVNRLRDKQPALLLAAGDFFQGTPWTSLFDGKSAVEVMNAMNFSAMVLGNHEFDFGQDVLKKRIAEAHFPILAANVRGLSSITPYALMEISGLNVAIIGLITEETPTTTHPKNVQGLTFLPVIQTAQHLVNDLRNKSDLIIVLSHLGLPADVELAKAVRGIDVIVGGHSHTRIDQPMKIHQTLIVQGWEHAKVLGVLDVTVRNQNIIRHEGRLIAIDPRQQKPDPLIAAIVDRYQQQTAVILDDVIGEAQVDLHGKNSRSRETGLGNLIADILRKQTHADIALINGGGIRADILKGPVRINDVLSVLPFSSHPVVLKVNGRELKEIFEHGVSDLEGTAGRFPQISGIEIIYQPANPVGQRIRSLKVDGKAIQPQSWYTLATNDFLAAGGDGYTALTKILGTMENKENHPMYENRVVLFDSGRAIRDMVIDFIKDKKLISATAEGRIQKED